MQWPRDKLNVGVAEFTIEAWLRCTLYVNICRIDVVDQMTLHVHIYAHIIQNIYSYTVIQLYTYTYCTLLYEYINESWWVRETNFFETMIKQGEESAGITIHGEMHRWPLGSMSPAMWGPPNVM